MKPSSLLTAVAFAGTLSLAASVPSSPSEAQSLECGSSYTVQSGDSLTGLAHKVYGAASSFQYIYSANAQKIGSNPGLIRIGAVLQIPCIDNLAPSTANAAVIRTPQTTGVLTGPSARSSFK